MSIKDLFLKLTKFTIPKGYENLMEKYLPIGWKKDFHGNYYIKIGDPTTMFTSHLDTCDDGEPKEVTHVIKGDWIETDGKTILGADDKAGTTIMIKMIEKRVTGLYYFFLNEEHGCEGSRALNGHLKTHRDDDLYKKIDKVVSFDRRDDNSVITFQSEDRNCSDEFGDELCKRLNKAGGFKFMKDPTGSVTDSHQLADKFAECTNLSVGYNGQHSIKEKQDIVFLEKMTNACCEIDWETLPVKRDPSKMEHIYSNYNRRGNYYGSEWENDRWWESNANNTIKAITTGPSQLGNAEFVTDYLGNKIKVANAQWCEYDKAWCSKEEAIWIDYIGFYTTPDFDPTKVKKEKPSIDGFTEFTLDNIKKDDDVYDKESELFGKIINIGDDGKLTISTTMNSKFILSPNKFLTYEFKKKLASGSKKLTEKDLNIGLLVKHPGFGEGMIIGIRPDKVIIKVSFKDKGIKDLRVDVADMKF